MTNSVLEMKRGNRARQAFDALKRMFEARELSLEISLIVITDDEDERSNEEIALAFEEEFNRTHGRQRLHVGRIKTN